MTRGIKVLTPEHKAKLAAGRAARKARLSASTLRQDFSKDDQTLWESLASEYKIRLPSWGDKANVSLLHKMFKKLRIDQKLFLEYHATSSLKKYLNLNTDWPARAIGGLILEWKHNTTIAKI